MKSALPGAERSQACAGHGGIEFKGSFSPDGREYYFYRHSLPEVIPTLYFTKTEKGVWTEPTKLPVAQGVGRRGRSS